MSSSCATGMRSTPRQLANRGRACVVDAGCGARSHPTQALVDAYTMTQAFGGRLQGLRILFLGPLLRSAVSFSELATNIQVEVLQRDVEFNSSRQLREQCEADIQAANVVYIQSLSDTSYNRPNLNSRPSGPALPEWLLEAIERASGFIMHALPRGPELPDRLMYSERSLIEQQVECGLPMRSAILRWLVERD